MKYRILKEHDEYFPQNRSWLGWSYMFNFDTLDTFSVSLTKCDTIEEAQDRIKEDIVASKRRKEKPEIININKDGSLAEAKEPILKRWWITPAIIVVVYIDILVIISLLFIGL